eukprot:56612-Alexandrium_andersonii.AAC.1
MDRPAIARGCPPAERRPGEATCVPRLPPTERRPGSWLNHEALSARRRGLDRRPWWPGRARRSKSSR